MALVHCQNFVSAQYLVNGLMEFLLSKFCFRSISSEQVDVIWLNFAYALTLVRSRLGLLRVDVRKFTTVMALGYCQNFFHT